MPYCPICERKFEDKRGLTGHFRFKHRYELAHERPAKETPMTRAIEQNIERRVSGDAVMKAMKEKEDKESKTESKRVEFRNIGGEPNENEYRERRVIFRNK